MFFQNFSKLKSYYYFRFAFLVLNPIKIPERPPCSTISFKVSKFPALAALWAGVSWKSFRTEGLAPWFSKISALALEFSSDKAALWRPVLPVRPSGWFTTKFGYFCSHFIKSVDEPFRHMLKNLSCSKDRGSIIDWVFVYFWRDIGEITVIAHHFLSSTFS